MRLIQRAAAWSLALACLLAPGLAAAQAIEILGSKVPIQAIGFGSLGGSVTAVTPANPLPMICISGCSATGAGTATAAAPTRAEGQSYGLSFDLNGGLRVSGGGGGGAGGTEFAEDSVHASGALGTFALVVRKDTAATLAGTDGDYTGLIVDALGRLHVNPGTVPVTGTFWQATQPVSLASLPLPAGAATSALQTPANASLAAIDADLGAAGDNTCATDVGSCSINAKLSRLAERLTAAVTELTAIKTATDPVPITLPGAATGYVYRSAATNNSTLVASGARTLYALPAIINTTSTVYYLRLYNGASAPTCSSGTGEVFSIPIPASSTGAGAVPQLGPLGVAFSAGLGFCLTGGAAANDNTSAATGVTVNVVYK